MPEEPKPKVEEPQSEVKSASSSNLVKFLLVAVLALVCSAGGGVVSWLLISRTTAMKAEAKAAETLDPAKVKIQQVADALEKGGALPLEPFVVNLADPDAARYLRIRVSLMVDEKAKIKDLTENTALQQKIRDVILQALTRKTSQDLINEEGKNKLRQEIQEQLTGYFKKPKLVDVMFTEFVIQL